MIVVVVDVVAADGRIERPSGRPLTMFECCSSCDMGEIDIADPSNCSGIFRVGKIS